MKHLLSTALLCGMSVLASQAQNIIIVDKDGFAHRYHADYVQDISFEKLGAQANYNVAFTSVSLNPYGKSNIGMTFTDGEKTLELDLYQEAALYLQPGEYTIASSNAAGTIGDAANYTYFEVGGTKHALTSGTLTVALNDETYTFTADFTLDNGETLKGEYTGILPIFGPKISYTLTGCSYANMNEPAANGFYYNFSDANYKLEMRIELFNSGETLNNGAYMFDNTSADGTASSYVNLYSPYNEVTSFKEGIVNVSGEGANRVVEINGMLENGIKMSATYTGELPGRPGVEYNIAFDALGVESYGTRNETITLSKGDDTMDFDFYQPTAYFLQPGTYTVDGSNADYTIDPAYSAGKIGGKSETVKSGTVVVARDGETYTFTVDVTLGSGASLKGNYTGTLPTFGPVLDYTFKFCTLRNLNAPAPNGHYYTFAPESWQTETHVDIFSDGTTPAEGTYTIADTKANGTCIIESQLYAPYNTTSKFVSGTVTVTADGVEIDGVLENGLTLKGKYTGALPTPGDEF